jgi:protein-disulfide isomerase
MTRLAATLAAAFALALAIPLTLSAQTAIGGELTPFRDTSMLKLPPGERAAIFDFEDLECPACAHAFPITHMAIEKYKIKLIRHDFLIQGHPWSPTAATIARYLQDKVSPEVAEQYRRDIFQNQMGIASKDDLEGYSRKWFSSHKLQMPFVVDPTGRFGLEVQADCNLGDRLGVRETPTIIVLGPRGWIQVKNIEQLYVAIDEVLAQKPLPTAAVHKTTTSTSKPK